ncbi:serine carboxypeptidase-like 7 [Phalaenopsis equestris]|uniref:serine carboxypeptidase-like 7 n=1 Tax=Phalaenopsis equestris TaxID=78828 RepID=UPI0009E21114|nr:serine carboxypeptidase-like 7 [Phalaenopsis equestris]
MSLPPNFKPFLFLFFSAATLLCLQTTHATTVTQLPGFHGPLPFRLETGYVSVDGRMGVELFYYFIESESEAGKDPVLLWLTGGPGCTSFFGLYQEIGPMKFNRIRYNGTLPNLIYHPYTWTKMFSIIFLDWPTGTGFSFSERHDNQMLNDYQSVEHIYTFLKKWFVDHSNFVLNPMYIGGDSYGGKMAALVSYRIAQGIEASDQPLLNFKGYLIGNPRTGIDEVDINPRVAHAYELAVISPELKEMIETNCVGENYRFPRTAGCTAKLQVLQKFLDEILIDNVLSRKCDDHIVESAMSDSDLNCPGYTSVLAMRWLEHHAVRAALGVKLGTVKNWIACDLKLKKVYMENIDSILPYLHSLLTRGYRALVYSGDHDLHIPSKGTIAWIESLNFKVTEAWRSWKINGQVGGYTVLYSNNLTFATVKGGGHEAAQDKQKECWTMLKRWISYEPL